MAVAVEALEAIARVRQADAAVQPRARARVQSDAVVPHLEPELVRLAARRDLHDARAAARRDAVLDRVLDERLQDQPRHLGVERVGIDLVTRPSADPGNASARSRGTSARNSSSSCSGTRAGARPIEREPQQIAEPADHPVGELRLRVHQRRDGVQRVEQKCGWSSACERPQPRVGELRLELRGFMRACLRLAVVRRARGSDRRWPSMSSAPSRCSSGTCAGRTLASCNDGS